MDLHAPKSNTQTPNSMKRNYPARIEGVAVVVSTQTLTLQQ